LSSEVIAKPCFRLRPPFRHPLQSRGWLYSGAAYQLRWNCKTAGFAIGSSFENLHCLQVILSEALPVTVLLRSFSLSRFPFRQLLNSSGLFVSLLAVVWSQAVLSGAHKKAAPGVPGRLVRLARVVLR
jgi:hypothetical protein